MESRESALPGAVIVPKRWQRYAGQRSKIICGTASPIPLWLRELLSWMGISSFLRSTMMPIIHLDRFGSFHELILRYAQSKILFILGINPARERNSSLRSRRALRQQELLPAVHTHMRAAARDSVHVHVTDRHASNWGWGRGRTCIKCVTTRRALSQPAGMYLGGSFRPRFPQNCHN